MAGHARGGMLYNSDLDDDWSGNDRATNRGGDWRLALRDWLDALMYISELGKHAGASPKAIRMYEALGLLGTIRRQGAYRIYSDDHVRQVRLIRQAQSLGFKLAEISPLLKSDGPAPNWAELVRYLELKRVQIREEIARLRQLDVQIGNIMVEIATCDGDMAGPDALLCDVNKA